MRESFGSIAIAHTTGSIVNAVQVAPKVDKCLADNAVFKSISFKGSPSVFLYLTGQVFYVGKFSLTYGVVGSTDSYPDQGVGMVSSQFPVAISIKQGWTTAPLLGVAY